MALDPELLQRVFGLGADERAALARELLLSLEDDREEDSGFDYERAWGEEIDARLLDADRSKGEEWPVVLERVRAGLKRRTENRE